VALEHSFADLGGRLDGALATDGQVCWSAERARLAEARLYVGGEMGIDNSTSARPCPAPC